MWYRTRIICEVDAKYTINTIDFHSHEVGLMLYKAFFPDGNIFVLSTFKMKLISLTLNVGKKPNPLM